MAKSTSIKKFLLNGPERRNLNASELVLLAASLWALNALAIDMMLPALGVISEDLNIRDDNSRQWLVVIYLLSNGISQLFFGPLVDRYGRRLVLLVSLVGYILASLFCIASPSFSLLLFFRTIQGSMTAATRIATLAFIRDQFSGREMARIISLVITVFMAAPIIAPAIGQLVMLVGPWRWIFGALTLYGLIVAFWSLFRLHETLPREKSIPLHPHTILKNYHHFFNNRISVGYTMASAMCFAGLFAYISAAQQIFLETFKIGNYFALAFAMTALPLALATITNSKLVEQYGMRKIGHVALIIYIISSASHFLFFSLGFENIFSFQFFMAWGFFALGMIGPNFTAISMEPMGHIAGSAGAANGFSGTAIPALIGGFIAYRYDGSVEPIVTGILFTGLAAFAIIVWVERGKLFEPLPRDHKLGKQSDLDTNKNRDVN